MWGTHTHVPTADTQILPKGTGFVTDLGMTGPGPVYFGHEAGKFHLPASWASLPRRYEAAGGPCKLCAVRFTIDTQTKTCVEVTRVDVFD